MQSGKIITQDDKIRNILKNARTIAILGLSPKPERDSNMVARYLKEQGYRIIPVRPAQKEILGEKVYASLDDIKETVDIVDVFRNPAQIVPHAHEAIRLKPKIFWMQLNSMLCRHLSGLDLQDDVHRCPQGKSPDFLLNRFDGLHSERLELPWPSLLNREEGNACIYQTHARTARVR